MAELINQSYMQVYDHLIGGSTEKLRTKVVTIVEGSGALKRGALLGKNTSTGKYNIVDATKTDGTEIADVVLADTVNAVSEINAVVYTQGEFNRQALSVAEGDTISAHEDELRKVDILLTTVRGM